MTGPHLNLADIGRHWARWQPDAVAVRFHGESITWRRLDERTDRVAAGFADAGVSPGDRVGVLMLNRPEWIETMIAAHKLGAVVVPLNVRFTPAEVAFVVADSGCRLLAVDDQLAAAAADAATADPELVVVRADSLARPDTEPPAPPTTSPDDPATICYTSGTTGDPKGAVLTHGSWNVASQGWAQSVALATDDRVYLPFPLAFTGGLAVWLFTYWAGARLVLDDVVDPGRTIDMFEQERLTALFAVPVIHQQIVDHPRFAEADLSSWRVACSGGASVPPSLIATIQARGVPMLQGYSLTEASACATILPGHDASRKLGSAGLPMIHSEIDIVDEDGRSCATGTVGEIVLRGPQVMAGYWNQPEATAETLRDGWLHTGDLGRVDDEGYLTVVDRTKDMLISGGLNVYPAEIERALAALPGVTELAVIGVADDRWGEVPAVVAVADDPAAVDGTAVIDAVSGGLADYKHPKYLVVRDTPLPRNMSGKVLKRELRDEYLELPPSTVTLR